MQTCYITFLSHTRANQFKKLAREHNLSAHLVQTPKELSQGGCSYSIKCNRKDLNDLILLSRKNKVSYSRVFLELYDTNGLRYFEEY